MPEKKSNRPIKKTTVILIAAVAFVIAAAMLLPSLDILPLSAGDEDAINTVEGHWWAPNGGWITLQWEEDSDCADCVRINKSAIPKPIFTGYAWGPNIGWVSMRDPSAANAYGVVVRESVGSVPPDGFWHVDNYAWGPNVGWLDFDIIDDAYPNEQPRIVMEAIGQPGSDPTEDARLKGYAWSPNIGWVRLDSDIPGWRDTTKPVLEYFDVQPETALLPPAEKYAAGVYKDEYACCGGSLPTFAAGHVAWVRPDIKFKAIMHSQDNHTRWHDLNISSVEMHPGEIADQYFWWDRLRFRPGEDPPFTGYIKSHTAEFLPNPDYPAGRNPDVPLTDGEVKVPSEEQGKIIWKSASHFLSAEPETTDFLLREFRYNARDAGGNYACPQSAFNWGEGKGCVLPDTLPPTSPMKGRVGVAVDKIVPSGSLYLGAKEFTEGETVAVSAAAGIDFTVKYIDTASGAYHVILDYRRKVGGLWPKDWGDPIGERKWNRGRETTTWDIDGNLEIGVEETETPLNTGAWPDGQEFQLRLRVIDNVGNVRERILPAVIDRLPPAGSFSAYDPIDRDPNRTRYAAVALQLPMSVEYIKMRFSNFPSGPWAPEDYKDYPIGGGWEEDWDLSFGLLPNASVTGGIKIIYADFCDATVPLPNCTAAQGQEIKATIAAPWFEGAAGDVYGGSGVGAHEGQFAGVAPYYTVGVQKYSATYRITSAGEIKPQITSGQGWVEGDLPQDFGYPGVSGTIAPIDFDNLLAQATKLNEAEVAAAGGINFGEAGAIVQLVSKSNEDPKLYNKTSGQPLVFSGKGTLLVDGNLRIETDMYYQDKLDQNQDPVPIDSLAILTRRSNNIQRGNVYVGDSVSHLVGAYIIGLGDCRGCQNDKYGSGYFHSSVNFIGGLNVPPELKPAPRELVVEGMVAARDFNLGRYSTGNQNFIANPSVEDYIFNLPGCPDGWGCAPPGPDIFSSSRDNVVADRLKLQINLKPKQEATLSQNGITVDLAGQTSLTWSGYLRATFELIAGKTVEVKIDGQPCALQPAGSDIKIDSQWRRFQCTVNMSSETPKVDVKITATNNLQPTGPEISPSFTLDLDAFQLESGDEATEWHDKFSATETNYMAAERFYYDGRVILNTPPGLAPLTSPGWGEAIAD